MISVLFSFVLYLNAQRFQTTTGSASDGIVHDNSELLQLLQGHRYIELEAALRVTPVGDPVERAFLEGVLANRSNRLEDAERLLSPLLSGGTNL